MLENCPLILWRWVWWQISRLGDRLIQKTTLCDGSGLSKSETGDRGLASLHSEEGAESLTDRPLSYVHLNGIVMDDVMDCDGCVMDETLAGDGCDGCDGLF